MRLQLERLGSSRLSSIPEVVRASTSPAKVHGVGAHTGTTGSSRGPIIYSGSDLVPVVAASSNSVQVGTSSQQGVVVTATDHGKSVAREEVAGDKRKTTPTSKAAQPAQADRRRKTNTPVESSASEVTADGTYFVPLLDNLDRVLGNYAKNLDRREVSGEVFDDYVARHSLLAFLGVFKQKEERERFSREKEKLVNVVEALKKEKKQLEENLALVTDESKKYRNKVEGLEDRVREAKRAKQKAEDDLDHEKMMYESAFSQELQS